MSDLIDLQHLQKSLKTKNNSNKRILGKNNKEIEGEFVLPVSDGSESVYSLVFRFHNGLLDGDIYVKGVVVTTKPAVEAPGHLEYWREGKLHRDGVLPAVVSKGFRHKEWWNNGKFIQETEE